MHGDNWAIHGDHVPSTWKGSKLKSESLILTIDDTLKLAVLVNLWNPVQQVINGDSDIIQEDEPVVDLIATVFRSTISN